MTALMLLKDNIPTQAAASFLGGVIPAISRVLVCHKGDARVETFQQVMEAMTVEADAQRADNDLRRAKFTVSILSHKSFAINGTVVEGHQFSDTRIDLVVKTTTDAPEFSSPAALTHGWRLLI